MASEQFEPSSSDKEETLIALQPRPFKAELAALHSLNLGSKKPPLQCLTIRKELTSIRIRKPPSPIPQVLFESPPRLLSPEPEPQPVKRKPAPPSKTVVECQMCKKQF